MGTKILMITCCLLWMGCQNRNSGRTQSDPPGPEGSRSPASSKVIAENLPKDTMTLNGTWYLQPVLASDSAAGKVPVLRFDMAKSRFSGNTGCNNMGGEFWYSAHDSSLSFSDKLVSTKMACPGYNEQAFLKSLKNTNHFRLRNGMLTLMSDATELSHWVRKGTTGPKVNRA